MGRWLAGRLMKELGLVSCQQPITGINVVVMNMLLSLTTLKGSSP
ncbi:IS911 ORF2 [Shigella sonnei]|nr:IS911 ORF2 [Shigella sonnei]